MKSPLAKALMTTSAKHIWTRTANRREPAKAIFFSNQIVFLIMFLFLPKLLIRHLEDFLLRGKCNKLVWFPASLPPARQRPPLPAAGSPRRRRPGGRRAGGCATGAKGRPARASTCCCCCSAPVPPCCTQQNRWQRCNSAGLGGTRCPATPPEPVTPRVANVFGNQRLLRMFPPIISPLSAGRGFTLDLQQGD